MFRKEHPYVKTLLGVPVNIANLLLLLVLRTHEVNTYRLTVWFDPYSMMISFLSTLIFIYITGSYIIALLNTAVVSATYITLAKESSLTIIYMIASGIWAILLARFATKKRDFIQTIDFKNIKFVRKDREDFLRRNAVLLAYLSLIYPASTLALAYVFRSIGTWLRIVSYVRATIPLFLSNLSLLIILTYFASNKKEIIVSATLAPLNAISFTPLLAHVLAKIREAVHTYCKPDFIVEEPARGLVFGSILSKLTYGYIDKPYIEIEGSPEGKTWYWRKEKGTLSVDVSKLPNRHVLIMGSSGSGKSLLAKHLIMDFYNKFSNKILIIDPHGEYIVLEKTIPSLVFIDTSKTSINPLELGTLSPKERASQLSHLVASMFKLGPLQRQALEEVFLKTYEEYGIRQSDESSWVKKPPAFQNSLDICLKYSSENEIYVKIHNYLKLLADNVFAETTINLSDILAKPTVFALNNLRSDYVRLLYVDALLHKLIEAMYRKQLAGEVMIVLDEAYALTSRELVRRSISRLFAESRKYGVGIVFITQNPLSTPPVIIENSAVKIAFNVSEPKNLDYAVSVLSGRYDRDKVKAVAKVLKNLKSLNYVVSFSGVEELFLVSEEEFLEKLFEKVIEEVG